MSAPAEQLNTAVRAEIVTLLECAGRKHLVDAAKQDDLVDVIGMLFSEISDNDSEAQAAPELRARVEELEALVADTRGPLQAQIAELNGRIAWSNERILWLERELVEARSFHSFGNGF